MAALRKTSLLWSVLMIFGAVPVGILIGAYMDNTASAQQASEAITYRPHGPSSAADGSPFTSGGLFNRPGFLYQHFADDTYSSSPGAVWGVVNVTGNQIINTKLRTVQGAWADINTTPGLNAMWANAHIDATAGQITLIVTKPTGSTTVTPVVSTTITSVTWAAIGQ